MGRSWGGAEPWLVRGSSHWLAGKRQGVQKLPEADPSPGRAGRALLPRKQGQAGWFCRFPGAPGRRGREGAQLLKVTCHPTFAPSAEAAPPCQTTCLSPGAAGSRGCSFGRAGALVTPDQTHLLGTRSLVPVIPQEPFTLTAIMW